MIIRRAIKSDSPFIARYLLLAMEDIIYEFIGEKSHQKALDFLLHFAQRENNQYSYQNCWVAEEDEVIAAINIYDGSQLSALRKPIAEYIQMHHGKDFNPEDETQAGEFYIDSFGVNPKQQGKGIGSNLLQFLIAEYVVKKQNTIGLLVEENNPSAKKLYLKLGFKSVGYKMLVGEKLEYFQMSSL
jgi:ribosomal protein S18 acetylase RimI-like enzyme